MRFEFWQKSTSELDAAGLFPSPAETDEQFADRLRQLGGELERLQEGGSDLLTIIQQSPPLSREVREAAARLTWEKYRFRADWVPGWYSSRRTGRFSAGIVLVVDGVLPLLFLHGNFAGKERRMGYDAPETLAHELVHAVRSAFPVSLYEEYFPCQVHASAFRRVCGNFFRRWYLPLLLFGGVAMVPILAAAESLCWWLPLIGALLVIGREMQILYRIRRASKKLQLMGMEPLPVLLRLSDQEIYETAVLPPDVLAAKRTASLRWKRFQENFPLRDGV